MNLLEITLLLLLFATLTSSKGLREEFTWTRINYAWPSAQLRNIPAEDAIAFPGSDAMRPRPRPLRQAATSNPDYIYENNIPMGANAWNNKLFITVPRRRVGVPSTLNYVKINSTTRHNTPLIPYPNWETNTLRQAKGGGHKFVSVYRVAVDSCDRLWFVDTGRIETPGNPQQVQPTALVIMDLKTDRVIQYHVIDDSFLRPATNLASVTVDITGNKCGDAFAYLPDLGGYGLIVYSLRENKAWRVGHNYFFLEPTAGEFTIGGRSFQWNDGIFSIAISGVKPDGFKDAYFHSMAGFNLYKVSTRILKNETLATRSYHEDDFQIVGHRGEGSQTSSSDLHASKGILFLGLVNQNALGCWNINTPISDISIVQKNDKTMIYPSDVKINDDNVILLTNTMPVFLYGTLDYDTTNFRVWTQTVDIAIKGTKCATNRRSGTKY